MRYISTRGATTALAFDEVLLAGMARDGGLYVPQSWPQFSAADWRAMRGLSYGELAVRVMHPFVGDRIGEAEFAEIVTDAYARFGHRAVAPLRQLDSDLFLMELFHGPTLAFKDVAMQLLGRLFDHVLTRRGERVTIVGATSGDTGSAAIEACRGREAVDIFILYPHGRVSEVQRRQMTTVDAANVHAIAVDGNFDDCQDLVKAMFADTGFRDSMRLSAVNSINWARVMAQTVYYVYGALALGAPDREVDFAVPSGNFGNVYAGYGALRMGLPIRRFLTGSNSNDILARFFDKGDLALKDVIATTSPSMDIQVSSNFERLLFDLYDRDGKALADAMQHYRTDRDLDIGGARLAQAQALFRGLAVDDEGVARMIREEYEATGELLDPHSAIGVAAARAHRDGSGVPTVALATAHPAKFPDAVEAASGIRPALPPRLADLYDLPERGDRLPNDLRQIQTFIRDRVALEGAA